MILINLILHHARKIHINFIFSCSVVLVKKNFKGFFLNVKMVFPIVAKIDTWGNGCNKLDYALCQEASM
jgi:hypothetical protein